MTVLSSLIFEVYEKVKFANFSYTNRASTYTCILRRNGGYAKRSHDTLPRQNEETMKNLHCRDRRTDKTTFRTMAAGRQYAKERQTEDNIFKFAFANRQTRADTYIKPTKERGRPSRPGKKYEKIWPRAEFAIRKCHEKNHQRLWNSYFWVCLIDSDWF